MSNEEAIKEIELWLGKCPFKETRDAFDLAIKALEERSRGEWIPVSERLPIKDGQYICTFYNGNFVEVGELWYFCILGRFETIYHTDDYRVIAWMPLPELYKEA